MPNPILSVQNLTKCFGKHIVINNVSFDVYEGEVFGILGPTDSGKSALLRAVIGSLVPSNGNIVVNEFNYKNDFIKAIQYVNGYITLPKLYRNMSGISNMKIFTSLRGNYSNEVLMNVAKIVEIDHLLKNKVKTYTISEKQKLCIAISIATNPKIIIMDDPCVGLNSQESKNLQDLIKLLAKKYKIAFILSSQMLGVMEKICDTIAIINNGSIIEIRSIESLIRESVGDQKIAFTVDYPNFAGKIILNEFNCKVMLCGNKVLAYLPETKKDKVVERLTSYKVNIFNVETINKSLESLLDEVLKQKAMNKSWIEEYN